MELATVNADPTKVDWQAVHSDLANVYERHGLTTQANIHRRLATAHEAARASRREAACA